MLNLRHFWLFKDHLWIMESRWENLNVFYWPNFSTFWKAYVEIIICFLSAVFSVTIKLVSSCKAYRPFASRSLEAVGSNPTQGTGAYLLSIHAFVFISHYRRMVVICQIRIKRALRMSINTLKQREKFEAVRCTGVTCHKNKIVMNSPWRWVLLEKPPVAHLRKTNPKFQGTRSFK